MNKILTTLICLLFVLSLSSFASAQIPQLQLQMPEMQQMQMGQTGQLGRGDAPKLRDTDGLGLNDLVQETAIQTPSCEDGSAAIPSSCAISDDQLAVECFPLRDLGAGTSRPVQVYIPGDEITYFRYFDSRSFLAASSEGLATFDVMSGEADQISVSPVLPTEIKDYIIVTSPISGLIMELILANDNSVFWRLGGNDATAFSSLIPADGKELVGIDYAAVNTKDLLWSLTDDGGILVADITAGTGNFAWTLALDISADLTSGPTAFVPAVGGFRVRTTTSALSFSIINEAKEWVMLVSQALSSSGSNDPGQTPAKPTVTFVKATPPVWSACLAERPQRELPECPDGLVLTEVVVNNEKTWDCLCEDGSEPIVEPIAGSNDVTYICPEAAVQECPESLTLVDAADGISCVCPDGSEPQYAIGSKDPVCPETVTVTECLEGELTLVDNEYKCIIEAECEEGSYLTTDPSGEEYCLWPASCPSGYTLTTLSDGSQVCASPALSATPTTLMIDSADAIPAPIAEEALRSPVGSAVVRGGAFSCQMAGGSGSPVDLFFLVVGLWGFVRYYARSRF